VVCELSSEHWLAKRHQTQTPTKKLIVTPEVAGDVIPFRTCCTTFFPFTGEAKVVSTLSANVVVAQVVIEDFGVGVRLSAVNPKANQGGLIRGG
jgi:hypothetical protein